MKMQHDSLARARVLILDDDEDFALAVHHLLELRHHEVRIAHDLETARTELAAGAPDVFVVDLCIGSRRSDDLIATVHETLPAVRCVLVSGSDRTQWGHLVEQGIVHRALTKPFDAAELIALVEDGPEAGADR
jgi:DNA-binding NtrC family response regulator